MINLSDRLYKIASMIEKGETVADIGTDHGYLPIYLLLNEISPSVVLTDISSGSLGKAKQNCSEYLEGQNAVFREGDGLEVLSPGEVDVVVLAGIGGLLTKEILEWDLEKSRSYKKFIMQPRNNGGALRKFLALNGFDVKDFSIVAEGARFCEIMLVEPADDPYFDISGVGAISDPEWEFPLEILSEQNALAEEYLRKSLEQEKNVLEKIIAGVGSNESESAEKDILYRKARIERLESLLSKIC